MSRIGRLLTGLLLIGTALVSCVTQPDTTQERLSLIYPEDRPFAESRFTTISGITIHYRIFSPVSVPEGKVLLLHGVGGSTYSFNRLAPLLIDAGYAVVAVDLPGFGYSDPALKFEHTADNRLALIWTLIDRLDTDSNQFNPLLRWFVVGHQMGGEFAVWMATDRPGRVAGLGLIATLIGQNRPGGKMAWFPPVRWGLRSWLTNSLYTSEGVLELLEDAYARAPTEEAVDGYLAPVVRADAEKALANFSRTVGPEVPDMRRLEAPVLFIWGTEDSWRSIDDGRLQAEAIPGSRFSEIVGAGHVPTDTHPDRVADLLIPWFESVVSSAE